LIYGVGDPTATYYFILLGACDSIHDCQKVPKHRVFAYDVDKAVAPDERRKYEEYLRRKEQQENYLHTPR
jgi:hypothetical protein